MDGWRTPCDNSINLETDQLGCEIRKPIKLVFRHAELKGDVLSFNVAEFAKALAERLDCFVRNGQRSGY